MRTARYLEMMPWLAPERKAHIEGVVQAARGLCMLYGGDLERTELIAVLHDCAKGIEKALLFHYEQFVKDFMPYPPTLHAPLGAFWARDYFGIEDQTVLDGIRYHCTGRPNMPLEEKIVFLADAIEPGRSYPGVEELRNIAKESLDLAVQRYLEHTVKYLDGKEINPLTLQALRFYSEGERMMPLEFVNKICELMQDKKAEQIMYIDLHELTVIADYFVVASALSSVQVKTICDYVEEKLAAEGVCPVRIDGYSEGRWIVLDFQSVIVHIFKEEDREFYRLERLWENGNNTVLFAQD